MTKIGVLGSGEVGKVLALGFKKHGHEVRVGSREGQKLVDWSAEHAIPEATFASVAAWADVAVLAVAGRVAEVVISPIADALSGKVVIDATNPIAGPPVKGILPYFTASGDSLMERLQRAAPKAHFVKAFSSVGNGQFVNPSFGGTLPTMFICGDDAAAKRAVTELLTQFGWDAEDVGGVEGARAIEPLCQLWCARGFLHGQWGHAFHLLRG